MSKSDKYKYAASSNPNLNSGMATSFSPEVHLSTKELLNHIDIDPCPKCPKCGAMPLELIGFNQINGPTLSKNHCPKCGHVWGPGDD